VLAHRGLAPRGRQGNLRHTSLLKGRGLCNGTIINESNENDSKGIRSCVVHSQSDLNKVAAEYFSTARQQRERHRARRGGASHVSRRLVIVGETREGDTHGRAGAHALHAGDPRQAGSQGIRSVPRSLYRQPTVHRQSLQTQVGDRTRLLLAKTLTRGWLRRLSQIGSESSASQGLAVSSSSSQMRTVADGRSSGAAARSRGISCSVRVSSRCDGALQCLDQSRSSRMGDPLPLDSSEPWEDKRRCVVSTCRTDA